MPDHREAVRDTITHVAHYLDARRYRELRELYADELELDYTQLFGGEVQRMRADDLITSWSERLAGLAATQHLLGPIDVTLQGSGAQASCHVRGQHWHKTRGSWVVSGHYRFELAHDGAAWRITRHALDVFGEEGSREVLG